MGPPPCERELIRKLVSDWHLSAPERRSLPGGKIRGSLIYEAIEEVLNSERQFPVEWQPEDSFTTGLIEGKEDGSYRITWKAESSMMHYEKVAQKEYASQRQAVEAFAHSFFGADIDGIPIDWSA